MQEPTGKINVVSTTTETETTALAADAADPDLSLFGVSLSGNVLLKYLGEAPDRIPAAVRCAIAVNPPIDLVVGC